SDKLYLGETRVLQEGKQGVRVRLIEVENGKRQLKEIYDKVVAQDRIVEVGTNPGTSLPEDEVKNLVLNRPELVVEEETIDFKVQERKSDKLYLGETRVLQEGKQGVRVRLIEVENGKRQLKETYDKVVAQDRIVEVGTAGETTKPVTQEATKPQVSEKADTKQIASSEAGQANKAQLPNTGSATSQAAVAAGLALLGLSAGLVATKGKKED
ncbi:MAG: G5 domain-containing protein, partial [Streptococcus mitis]|nr:G5 domain-containing protein [Streptococcus mitis]